MSSHRLIRNKGFRTAGLAAAALFSATIVAPRCASAALVLDYNNNSVVITDNGAGDTDPTVGRINNNTTIAGFGVSINIATSNSPGTPINGLLQIDSLDVRNNNAEPATLQVRVSDTNFTLPAGPAMALSSATGGTFTFAPAGDSASFRSFADPANGQPAGAVSTPLLTFTANGTSPQSFNGQNSIGWVRGAGPYSLTNITTMTLSPNAQLNISGTTSATPEPAVGLALVASGALGLLRRRRS